MVPWAHPSPQPKRHIETSSCFFSAHYCDRLTKRPCFYCIIIRPHHSTTYVDAAYPYRPNSVVCRFVCLSVCHTSEPCKNGCTDRAAIWVEDLGGPGNHVLDGSPDPSMGRGKFLGENGRPIVKYRDTLRSSVQRRLN